MGYWVYAAAADLAGSDAVPLIRDGQSREEIEMVERNCALVCCVTWTTRLSDRPARHIQSIKGR